MIEAFLVFALAIGLGWPLGRYLAAVLKGEYRPDYPVFDLGRMARG